MAQYDCVNSMNIFYPPSRPAYLAYSETSSSFSATCILTREHALSSCHECKVEVQHNTQFV